MDFCKLKTVQLKHRKLKAFSLQEVLIVLLIIGVFMLIALPNLMPLVVKAKSIEAQMQLKYIFAINIFLIYIIDIFSY